MSHAISDLHPILLALLIPGIGSLLIGFAGRMNANLRETVTMLTAAALAYTVWGLVPGVMDGERPELTLATVAPGLDIHFAIEPLGMIFACLASGLWIINSIYSIGYMRGNNEKHQTRFYLFFAVALAATMGVAFAGNLFTLFLSYEVLTLSTYPLVSHKGDTNTVRSARIYLGILLTTSIGLLLPAIIWTYVAAGTGDFTAGGILADKLTGPALALLLALYLFGIGKAAVMPVHRWLPAAMVAPTPVSALLHAVAVVKTGVFAITKIVIYIFGVEYLSNAALADFMLYAAAFTVIAASLVALQQTNLKRMLAYSTIAQLSYVVLAVSILTPISQLGATLHIVAHAFGKITLFFAAGAIYVAAHKTELPQLAGIGKRMPFTMVAFTIGALSMIGVPPTAGFVSKWYILAASLEAENLIVIGTIIISTVLNAAYFLPVVYSAWFVREPEGSHEHGEAPVAAVIALTATAMLTILFFLFNAPVLDLAGKILEAMR